MSAETQVLVLFYCNCCGPVFTFHGQKDAFAYSSGMKLGGNSCWCLVTMPHSGLNMKRYSSCEVISWRWRSQSCWLCSTVWCKPCASGGFLFSSSRALETAAEGLTSYYLVIVRASMEGIKIHHQQVLDWRLQRKAVRVQWPQHTGTSCLHGRYLAVADRQLGLWVIQESPEAFLGFVGTS